jgi:hypothetical protein
VSNKKLQYTSLIAVLANGSTANARSLLLKNTGQDAKNKRDLANRLAMMYMKSHNKIDVEKAFAEMHPHKDFLMKYLSPTSSETLKVTELNPSPAPLVPTPPPSTDIPINTVVVDANKSNFSGEDNSYCRCPNCRGGYSNASGNIPQTQSNVTAIIVVGIVGLVALAGMVMYLKKDK